jgi:hypothetical protein
MIRVQKPSAVLDALMLVPGLPLVPDLPSAKTTAARPEGLPAAAIARPKATRARAATPITTASRNHPLRMGHLLSIADAFSA